VRNGFLSASAEAETEQSQHRAHVWLNRERGVDEARHEVAGLLTSEIARRLRNLEGAPTPEVTPTREADVEEEEASTDGAQPSSTPDAVGAEPVEPGRDEGVTEP